MKKILLNLSMLLLGYSAFSQNDTLLFENFQADNFPYIQVNAPNGSTNETTNWFNFDEDGLPDGSPSNRPGEWFLALPFATADEFTVNGDSNFVLASNSWSNVNQYTLNWIITPKIQVNGPTTLSWKSAPRQTPRYLDGYEVRISTTDNYETSFTTTLFTAGEYISAPGSFADSSFANYNFSTGFIHGEDGTFIEYNGDSARFIGELRPFSISLNAYIGQSVYIAFLHKTMDDNLISIDDILVTGVATSIKEETNDFKIGAFPNPASNMLTLNYTLPISSPIDVMVYDFNGRLIESKFIGMQIAGKQSITYSVANLANGEYSFVIRSSFGTTTQKVIVNK
ncbi:MAG: choice-of-anchor J domain-containing protein [Bacteroidia bacterium]